MRRRSSQPLPWGYILPLKDGLPSFELRLDKTSAGLDDKCTLSLDPELMQLPTTERTLFHVTRRDNSRVVLRDNTKKKELRVEGKCLREHPLRHGSRIGVACQSEDLFVFLDRAASESFQAPQKILDTYMIAQCLGKGGFGQVYLLFDRKSNFQKRYAMKVVKPGKGSELVLAERERQILGNLNHPCVITTYKEIMQDTQHFFVMEYLPGGDLSRFVNDKKLLSEAQTKLIFLQLAVAVSYLHANNVCHRDLKPANILLQRPEPNTLIKVTDFGLAKKGDIHSIMTTQAGTELYLAPEVMTESTYTKQVDVWSMGIILFYALSGALPFPGGNSEAFTKQHQVYYPSERWRGVSLVALELVKRMLKVGATQRLTITQVVDSEWLQDDAIREEAFKLTGLKEIQPKPKKTSAPTVKRASSKLTPRPLSGPRGVFLEHLARSPTSPAPITPQRFNLPGAVSPARPEVAAPAAKAPVRKMQGTPPRVADLPARTQQPTPPLRNPANIRGGPIVPGARPSPGVVHALRTPPMRQQVTPRAVVAATPALRTPPAMGAIARLASPVNPITPTAKPTPTSHDRAQ